uniref:RagB/SusD family nutrient uptake outer membrane protein n=1 Tax=Prevotella sp. TaxID=59823 RepID=UPI0040271232
MKKYILSAAMVLATSMALTSCEDAFGGFLDKEPSNELTGDQTFSSWTTMEQFHFDTYNFLLNGCNRVGNSWLDAATDLAESSISSSGARVGFNIGNYYADAAAAELTNPWESRYRGIRKCNTTLKRIDEVPKSTDDTQEQYEEHKSWIKGEARFFRAYFLWDLFLKYGPVPVVQEVLDPNGDLLTGYSVRPTMKEMVVDFIIPELKECEAQVMDKATSDIDGNQGRISKPIVRALLSRIYLYMASPRWSAESGITWQDAADMAKSFIDDYGQNYGLYYGENLSPVQRYTNAILLNGFTEKNNEVIFYRNDGTFGWGAVSADTPVGEGGNGGLCPSQNLVDMYDMANGSAPFNSYDATGAPLYNNTVNGVAAPTVNTASGYDDTTPVSNRDPRLAASILYNGVTWGQATTTKTNVIDVTAGGRDNPVGNANATPTGYYVRKYMPEVILNNNHAGASYRNWIICRYAEILLNYAEALNEVDFAANKTEVCNLLDQIRHRAGITGDVKDRTDLNSQEAMRNFIHKERTIELAFEEHRSWDVRRWNVAKQALGRDIYGVNVTKKNGRDVYTRKVAQKRVFDDKMYLYPIPEAEMWKLPSTFENNEGWK